MKNLLYVIKLDDKKIAFTNGREYIRFVNSHFLIRPVEKAQIVGLFDEDAKAVDAGTMDKKIAYFLNYGKCQTIAFNSELARNISAREIGVGKEKFFEATCYNWSADVDELLNKNNETEGC